MLKGSTSPDLLYALHKELARAGLELVVFVSSIRKELRDRRTHHE